MRNSTHRLLQSGHFFHFSNNGRDDLPVPPPPAPHASFVLFEALNTAPGNIYIYFCVGKYKCNCWHDQCVDHNYINTLSSTYHQFYHWTRKIINPFQLGVALHIKTSHLFYSAKQMTGFYMKSNTGLKCINIIFLCLYGTL